MNLFRLSTVLLFAALASACASAPQGQSAPAAGTVVDGSTAVAASSGWFKATIPPKALVWSH